MLRRSFLSLLGVSLFGFLPKHLQLPGPQRGKRKYYVESPKQPRIFYAKEGIVYFDIEGNKPTTFSVAHNKKAIYRELEDGKWIITHIEC